MFQSPFSNEEPQPLIPEDAEVVFVSDMFVGDYVGGAELTTQAIIDAAPFKVACVKSQDVSLERLQEAHKKYWLFGNFSGLDQELIPTIVANMNYSVLEYDYKYCKWRSPQKHETAENTKCNDQETMKGKMVSAFMYGADSLWWMSEAQMSHYHSIFPFLQEKENIVLSSVFDDTFFLAVKMLKEKYKDTERKGWVVLGSTSWVKGADAAEEWCKDNDKEYEVVWNLPYEEVLEKLAKAEGFVYLPQGWDTCPRMVIEAKMLGCQLEINDNVQHKAEAWFETDDPFDTEAYLYAARDRFWSAIKHIMVWNPKLSGYTTTLNCKDNKYPWKQSIESMLGFADEVVVVDGGSSDGTWEELLAWSEKEDRLSVHLVERDWNHPRFAVYDGEQKAEARSRCTGEFCWQQDADEVVHEDDYKKIHELVRNFPKQIDVISLPVVEYWGSSDKVRLDVTPWKWRLTRNSEEITHGIPKQLRKSDKDGNLYASLGTDGCDYVHNETYEVLPHASFYTAEVEHGRQAALSGDTEVLKGYQEWFNRNVEMLPSVHHYSWFDLSRKIRLYRDYWSQHWQSLYDIPQEDTPENNMFFDKAWADVSDKEIDDLASELKEKMGGWVFHERVDFSKPTPHINLDVSQPKIMNEAKGE
jgi:glycosyltransferase involved in cell wall biosynthesis/CRISPR/Cas system-associated exonuclease Cas4 (RecB family)